MFIPIEGEDCIFLQNVVALIHGPEHTTIYYADGRTGETGFRPVTLARRYRDLMKDAVCPQLSPQEVNDS